jgi:hypothetical protein
MCAAHTGYRWLERKVLRARMNAAAQVCNSSNCRMRLLMGSRWEYLDSSSRS